MRVDGCFFFLFWFLLFTCFSTVNFGILASATVWAQTKIPDFLQFVCCLFAAELQMKYVFAREKFFIEVSFSFPLFFVRSPSYGFSHLRNLLAYRSVPPTCTRFSYFRSCMIEICSLPIDWFYFHSIPRQIRLYEKPLNLSIKNIFKSLSCDSPLAINCNLKSMHMPCLKFVSTKCEKKILHPAPEPCLQPTTKINLFVVSESMRHGSKLVSENKLRH